MGKHEEFLEFQYKTIEVLNEQDQTLLVRDQLSGRILVWRRLPLEDAEIYLALKEIRHKNLVQISEVYRLEDCCIVLEEYVNGCSVADILKQGIKLEKHEAAGIVADVCQGLSALHERHMVYRNIRPDTIRINQDGVVKLMDFSAIRQFHEEKPRDTTLIGTAGYAAPEQFGFSQSDERTDIYAAGVLLNQLLTGKLPKERMYWKDGRLHEVIRICTQINKEQRFANVSILKRALESRWETSEKAAKRRGKKTLGFAQRFYGGLPGLRNGAWYWKVFALILYFLLVLASYAMIVLERDTHSAPYIILELLQLLLPAAVLFNAWNISRLSLLPKSLRLHFRIVLAVIPYIVLDGFKGLF